MVVKFPSADDDATPDATVSLFPGVAPSTAPVDVERRPIGRTPTGPVKLRAVPALPSVDADGWASEPRPDLADDPSAPSFNFSADYFAAEPPASESAVVAPRAGTTRSSSNRTSSNRTSIESDAHARFRDARVDDAPEPDDEPEPLDPEARLAEFDRLIIKKLARKPLSEWEVAQALRASEADDDEIEYLLSELRRKGYVDDAALAEQLVESLHNRKGQSRSIISRELSAKHIDQSIIQNALDVIDDDDELARALVVAHKRAGQLSSYDTATAERRLTAYLVRRGYGSSTVREACRQALSGSKRSGVSFR